MYTVYGGFFYQIAWVHIVNHADPYAFVLIGCLLISLTVAAYAWRRRPTPGALSAALFMLAAAEWTLAYVLELTSVEPTVKLFWAKAQYLGITAVGPLLLILVLDYLDRRALFTRGPLAALFVLPAVTQILVWTNEAHGWIWSRVELVGAPPNAQFAFQYGLVFWVHAAYSYACILAATALLIRALRRVSQLYRLQIIIVLISIAVPLAANMMRLVGWNLSAYLDLTPFAFALSGLIIIWGLFRYQLFDIRQVARNTVLDTIADGVIVVDEHLRIVDLNPAAARILGCSAPDAVGKPAGEVLARWPEIVQHLDDRQAPPVEAAVQDESTGQVYDWTLSWLRDRKGRIQGQVAVVRNTTTLRTTQQTLQEQNLELRRLSQAVEQSSDSMIITDLEGRIEYVNRGFEANTGYCRQDVLGQPLHVLLHEYETVLPEIWQTLGTGQTWHGECQNQRQDGTPLWEEITISPVHDQEGAVAQYLAIQKDITARKLTQDTLTKLLELSRVLTTTRQVDAALAQAIDSAVDILPTADRGTVQWLDKDGETLYTVATSDQAHLACDVPAFARGQGIAGIALQEKRLINVPDVERDERFVTTDLPLLYHSLMVAPLMVRGEALGTLSLSSSQIDAFSRTDEALAQLMADQIAALLENAYEFSTRLRVEEDLKKSSERLRILHEIDQAILAARLPETIAVAAVGRIRHLIPCQRTMVMVRDARQGIRLLAAESTSDIEPLRELNLYTELFSEPALSAGRVHGAAHLSTQSRRSALQERLWRTGIESYLAVPLFVQSELVGTLNFESREPRAFSGAEIAIATEVAVLLAVAIRQAQLHEQMRQEISERKLVEETLRYHAVELESQNAELSAFAHTVAHDLKNPLATLIGYAEMLEETITTLPDEVIAEGMHVITQHGRRMATIIDDLLLLASVRQVEELCTEPLDMAWIVAQAQERLSLEIDRRQGTIVSPDQWPEAVGYAPWVEAVWANYISNALKYGGQPPLVQLGAGPVDNGSVRFWVRDNGPGLTPEEQLRLFTPFERLHTSQAEGHGLGLSIVRRIVQKLGGRVGIESTGEPGSGSLFFFTLPSPPA